MCVYDKPDTNEIFKGKVAQVDSFRAVGNPKPPATQMRFGSQHVQGVDIINDLRTERIRLKSFRGLLHEWPSASHSECRIGLQSSIGGGGRSDNKFSNGSSQEDKRQREAFLLSTWKEAAAVAMASRMSHNALPYPLLESMMQWSSNFLGQ